MEREGVGCPVPALRRSSQRDLISSALQLRGEPHCRVVYRPRKPHLQEAVEIRWEFHRTFLHQAANARATEKADEKATLKDYVLSGAGARLGGAAETALIVRSNEHDRIAHVGMSLNLLDDGPTLSRLTNDGNGLEAELAY